MKRSLLVLSLLVALLFLVSCSQVPTGTGSITGFVLLQSQNDYSNITVQLEKYNLSSKTKTDGSYTLSNLADGTYTVTFSKTGYKSVSKTAQITNGSVTEIPTFTLLIENPATLNPIKGELHGHGCSIDLDSGEITTNWLIADLRLSAFNIFQGYYNLYLDETTAAYFPEIYSEYGGFTFSQFANITTTDYPLETKTFDFHVGDVFLIKTTEEKYVKLLVYDHINDYSNPEAPSVKFVYLYDNIVDTTLPTILEIKVYTADGSEYTQIPHGELTFEVTSRPTKIQFIFDEFVKTSYSWYEVNESLSLSISPDAEFIPFYDTHSSSLESIISEPGTYTITPLQSDFYFEDLSTNQLTELPFSSIVIQYNN